jgi:hypothetical protein
VTVIGWFSPANKPVPKPYTPLPRYLPQGHFFTIPATDIPGKHILNKPCPCTFKSTGLPYQPFSRDAIP